ncbi:unnamed protein product [Notodromas monacha]|uniref:protein-serine/threonine phosphatase n=1 Tax=Notodromas monacha TaxID=399045 RepID=A0A7R9BGF2_9CRUS|nr:unnamed protein product [Notodromas monacha]CAG0914279.1 unnamed protein product [Notodromas monacha]
MVNKKVSAVFLCAVFVLLACLRTLDAKKGPEDLLLFTVATEETDGLKRFLRSATIYKHNAKVLGLDEDWKGGDVARYPGGGQKVRLLKEELKKYKDESDRVVLFTDGYDVILTGTPSQILEQFYESKARILFGAEATCWPDVALAEKYPEIETGIGRAVMWLVILEVGRRYDVILTGTPSQILEQFYESKARILFGAEATCWPDVALAEKYPEIETGILERRAKSWSNFTNLKQEYFLGQKRRVGQMLPWLKNTRKSKQGNASSILEHPSVVFEGRFIGYASDLFKLVSREELKDSDDDQLFYTTAFLDEKFREKHSFKLDHRSSIFQNLNMAMGDVELQFRGKDAFLQNIAYGTVPLVIHGNGATKLALNSLGNYLAKSWNAIDQCVECQENMNILENRDVGIKFISDGSVSLQQQVQEAEYPIVTVAVFVEQATPFFEEFLLNLVNLNYPKNKIDLFIHSTTEYHSADISTFLSEIGSEYRSFKLIDFHDNVKEWHARNGAMDYCEKTNCDWLFTIDAIAHLDNPHTLRLLVEQNRNVIAPLLIRPLFRTRYCEEMIEELESYGKWSDGSNFDELFELINNRWDWEKRYLHVNYSQSLAENTTIAQPCPDVFWFPIVTDRYCEEMIEELESYGKWSDGSNSDERLPGGYENVPTIDIHMRQIDFHDRWMHFLDTYDTRIEGGYENVPTIDIHLNQVGLHEQWLFFLEHHVYPLVEKVYQGYSGDPPKATMNFVVRYKPDEQPLLRPHHDSSTYTINIALNRVGIDYEEFYGLVKYTSICQFHMGQTLSEPVTTKESASVENSIWNVGSSSMQGWRVSMEDSHTHILSLPDDPGTCFFGVYDGHGGCKISQHVGKHLHKYIVQHDEFVKGNVEDAIKLGFLEMDQIMLNDVALKEDSSGTTAVIVLVKDGKLYCGNVGDSRAVASLRGVAEELSMDHKPTSEKELNRIVAAGGYVEYSRVNGNLALSRALGDYGYKQNVLKSPEEQIVTAFPDVEVRQLTDDYEFLLIACDGIWDVLSSQDAVDFVRQRIGKGLEPEAICEALLEHCLAPDLSFGGLGCDNMTAILAVYLNGRPYEQVLRGQMKLPLIKTVDEVLPSNDATDSTASAMSAVFATVYVMLIDCCRMKSFQVILRFAWIVFNNVYCIPTYTIWMFMLLPLRLWNPYLYWRIEAVMYEWLLNMVAAWNWTADYRVVETGDDIDSIQKDSALFLFNHQSTSDVPLIMNVVTSRVGVTQSTMWIMDKLFRWTNFGVVSFIHGDFFITSGKAGRDTALVALRHHLQEVYVKKNMKWIMLFPEGGFLYKRREASQQFAKKYDLPVLQHVTLPRVGAMHVVLQELCHLTEVTKNGGEIPPFKSAATNPGLKWVIDVTVAYAKGIPLDLLAIAFGDQGPQKIIFHYKRFAVDEVPHDEESLKTWLYKRYEEKEQKLKEFYTTGQIGETGRNVQHSAVYFLALHCFFLLSSWFHWSLVRRTMAVLSF